MTINELIMQLRSANHTINFKQVMQVINRFYDYTPTSFTNAATTNKAGSNEGSCKIFYFAQLHDLSEAETLNLFGSYYRDDVLCNPTREDHANIRHFMKTGWSGLKFDGVALTNNSKD
jgi:hypothetical protein